MPISTISSVSDIFRVMGGNGAVARAIGVGASTASEMKRRGRVPAEYWHDLVRAARGLGHREITADLLAELHARKATPIGSGFGEDVAPSYEANDGSAGKAVPASNEAVGHFTRFKHLRRSNFASAEEVADHVRALRDEWDRR